MAIRIPLADGRVVVLVPLSDQRQGEMGAALAAMRRAFEHCARTGRAVELLDTPAGGELRLRLFYQARREWERGIEGLPANDQVRLLIGADAALAETGEDACLPEMAALRCIIARAAARRTPT